MSLFRKGAVMEKASEGMADQLEKVLRDSLPDDLTPEQVAALDPSRFEMAEYDDTLAEKTGYSSYSYWRSTFRAFWNNRLARFLLVALLLLIAFTIIQPHLPGQRRFPRPSDWCSQRCRRTVRTARRRGGLPPAPMR